MDAQELPAGELHLELLDAAHRGEEATLVGDEPDVIAVRLREVNLGPAQEDHALAAHAHDARRKTRPGLRPLELERVTEPGPEDRERSDRPGRRGTPVEG